MKRYILSTLAMALVISMVSCGGGKEDEENTNENPVTEDVDFEGMSEMSLKDNGLNMKIMLPQVESSTGASIEPQVIHEDGDYLWHVKIGNKFHLVIEDFGKEKNKVADEKERLADLDDIFVIEFIEDTDNLIMYKRTLHADQGGKPSYHVYGETVVDGYTYVLRSQQDGSFKPIIEDMAKTIKSAKPITEA
ncbi:MAG: hypothetical protein HUJ25_10720 [Crocinitomicaceae bacterium]|nr:hypothetical protein [Crocinitomicaceae bacterium]